MTKGRIELRPINLMGYTPSTQVFVVQNVIHPDIPGSSVHTAEFLQAHRKHFAYSSFGYTLPFARIAKFKAYAASKGFEVIENWSNYGTGAAA